MNILQDLRARRMKTASTDELALAWFGASAESAPSRRGRVRAGSVTGRPRALLAMACLCMAVACAQPASTPDTSDTLGEAAASRPVEPAPTRGPAAARPRIVFLGDSLSAGYGLQKEQSVPFLIQQRLEAEGYDYEVINASVSGDTSAGGLSRLDWSLEGDVRMLVVELGGNDGLRGLPVASLRRNLDEIITRAKQRGITVVLTGMEAPPNYGAAYTSEFRQVFGDLAREHDVAFMPFFLDGVAGEPSLNLGDGIHPNAAGARIVEGNLWDVIEPLLENRSE